MLKPSLLALVSREHAGVGGSYINFDIILHKGFDRPMAVVCVLVLRLTFDYFLFFRYNSMIIVIFINFNHSKVKPPEKIEENEKCQTLRF